MGKCFTLMCALLKTNRFNLRCFNPNQVLHSCLMWSPLYSTKSSNSFTVKLFIPEKSHSFLENLVEFRSVPPVPIRSMLVSKLFPIWRKIKNKTFYLSYRKSYRTYLLEYGEHFLTAIAILSQWKCSLRKWFLLGRISHPLRPKIES